MSRYVFDSEVYRNYYLIAFLEVDQGTVEAFELPFTPESKSRLFKLIKNSLIIGFNSIGYDIPLLMAALKLKQEVKVKSMSDAIIKNGLKHWNIYKRLDMKEPQLNHVDLIEVAPSKASLKMYGGRLNCERMQSLPIHFDAILSDEEKEQIKDYCINDLEVTRILFLALEKHIKLRGDIGKKLNVDCRSKSDAQIAEVVFKSKLGLDYMALQDIKNQNESAICESWSFHYVPPSFLSFKTQTILDVFENVKNAVFTVQSTGKCTIPKGISTAELFGKVYKMGVGGLHSTEKSTAHLTTKDHFLCDHDVASYYPSIILNQGIYPPALGPEFIEAYRDIYNTRLEAKRKGDTVVDKTLKITLNGSFGKLGSRYSFLYAPELLIQTTLTGQLALLMLIERFELAGIPVVSANTDGVVVKCPANLEFDMYDVILQWENETDFVTEENRYTALYSRDVNNYIAIKGDEIKSKGAYAPPSLMKNISNSVCVDAVCDYLKHGTPLLETLRNCDDVSRFVTIRTVKGGAVDQEGVELGTAIRWYYAKYQQGFIAYVVNGKKVPKTDGAKPLQQLSDSLPEDIDYDWYLNECESILEDIGYYDT